MPQYWFKIINNTFGRVIGTILKISRLKRFNDYHYIHAHQAKAYLNPRGKKCLVVGCAKGEDCTYFIKFGAKEVIGVDIADEIGKDFINPKVKYCKTSAEKMEEIQSNYFDLVYCVATMEHIPRIDLAFCEMVRVTKQGGIIYCVSAPLWNSSQGHHKSFFANYPWIHLRLSKEEIIAYCIKNDIRDTSGARTMEQHINHMLNKRFFNMLPAQAYVDVCDSLTGITIIQNELSFVDSAYLTPEIYSELMPKGYTKDELLALVHTFIARKQ